VTLACSAPTDASSRAGLGLKGVFIYAIKQHPKRNCPSQRRLRKDGPMIVTLIGMSGSGKTYCSRRLAELGFDRICCDERIEEKLRPFLRKGGYKGIEGLARWMGQPHEPRYREREAAYLSAETDVVQEVLDDLQKGAKGSLAIDTTGSVVYAGDKLCRALQAATTVIYLENSPADLSMLFEEYTKNPKPVVWGDSFSRRAEETIEAALARSYGELLQYRRSLYERYAEITLPASLLRKEGTNSRGLLDLLQVRRAG